MKFRIVIFHRQKKITNSDFRIQFFPAAAAIDEAVRYFDKTVVYDLYR